jgi:hypothetical protein
LRDNGSGFFRKLDLCPTWGFAIGQLINIPLTASFQTKVLEPIVFDRTGYEVSLN